MKQYKLGIIITVTLAMTFASSCKKTFLDVQPTGVLTEEALNTVQKQKS